MSQGLHGFAAVCYLYLSLILQKKVEQMSQAFLFMAMFHQRLILGMTIAKRAIGIRSLSI